jgi:hypothetical protein
MLWHVPYRHGAVHRVKILRLFNKTAMLGESGGIARSMQDTDNHEVIFVMHIVDGVVAGKADAQTRRKILTRGCGERKVPQRLTIVLDLVDQARRCRLRGFNGDIKPDFGQVGFGSIG